MAEAGQASSAESRFSRYREKLIEAAILTLPLSLVSGASLSLKDDLLADPWKILWIVVPLGAAAWLSWRMLGSRAAKIDRRWFVFLGIYSSIFALASTSELLVWKRLPAGYYANTSEAGRAWAVPLSLGDWRYRLVKRVTPSPDNIVILLMDPVGGDTKERARLRDKHLVDLARSAGAAGIAFDVAFEGPTKVDSLFCDSIRQSGFQVISTYDLTRSPGALLAPRPPTQAAIDCLPLRTLGHAMGFAEADGTVRAIPLYWEGDSNAPAFSLRVAKLLHDAASGTPFTAPRSALLRFVPPGGEIPVIRSDQLEALEKDFHSLRNYFVIVGERSQADTFRTPFGPLSGAMVHAYAIYSLLTGNYISRPPALYSAFIVFASCYMLTLLASRGVPAGRLVAGACALSLAIFALSAAAIYFWRVWLDVVYAIAATWLLVLLLLSMRLKLARTPVSSPGE